MKKMTFVRHGESEANAGGVSQPNELVKLTALGLQQAMKVADKWHKVPAKIYTSEFIRTEQTAKPLLEKYKLKPTRLGGLNEFDIFSYEVVEGMTGKERLPLTIAYWEASDPDARCGKHGQTYREFCQRVADFIPTLLTLEDNCAIFGHGMWFRQLVWQALGMGGSATDAQNMNEFMKFSLAFPVNNADIFDLYLTDGNVFVQKQ